MIHSRTAHGSPLYMLVSLALLAMTTLTLISCGSTTQAAISQQGARPTPQRTSTGDDLYLRNGDALYRMHAATGEVRWHVVLPTLENLPFTDTVALAHNLVYTRGPGNDGVYVYAFNSADGSLRWKFRYGDATLLKNATNSGSDGPGVLLMGKDRVYIVSDADEMAPVGPHYPQGVKQAGPLPQPPGTLSALDALSGRLLWQQHLPYRLNDPIVDQDTIYGIASTSTSGALSAINGADGATRWRRDIPQSSAFYYSLQAIDGALYCLSMDDGPDGNAPKSSIYVHAYAQDGGHPLWRSQVMYGNSSSVLVSTEETLAFALEDHAIYTFNRRDGSLRWQRKFSAFINGLPFAADGQLYVATQPDANTGPLTLQAISATSSQPVWSRELPNNILFIDQFTSGGGQLYVEGLEGSMGPERLLIFAPSSGAISASCRLPSTDSVPGRITVPAR